MGFKRGALILEWPEDSEFSGLEVRLKRLSIRQLMRVEKLSDLREEGNGEDTAEIMTELLDAIGEGLLSWNYEDDAGTAVPAVRASLDDLDVDMVLALVSAWTKAAASVPLASPPNSPTGAPDLPDAEWASWAAMNQETSPEPVSS
jgi:hypothetical protein